MPRAPKACAAVFLLLLGVPTPFFKLVASYPSYFVNDDGYSKTCFDHPTRKLGDHAAPVVSQCVFRLPLDWTARGVVGAGLVAKVHLHACTILHFVLVPLHRKSACSLRGPEPEANAAAWSQHALLTTCSVQNGRSITFTSTPDGAAEPYGSLCPGKTHTLEATVGGATTNFLLTVSSGSLSTANQNSW